MFDGGQVFDGLRELLDVAHKAATNGREISLNGAVQFFPP
jgi:hypothetical protein